MIRHLLVALCILALTAGCWGRIEIDELAFVEALGIDIIDDQFLLTLQIADYGTTPGGMGASPENTQEPAVILTAKGRTIFEATRNLTETTTRQPFYGYLRHIVIGEELARQGLEHALDWVGRDDQLRRSVHLFIAKDTTANELLSQAQSELDIRPGRTLERLVTLRHVSSVSLATTLADYIRALLAPGVEPLLAVVELDEAAGDPFGLRLAGAALFDHDQLVGYLSPTETRGWLWTQGMVAGAALTPDSGDELITFEILRQNTSWTVDIPPHVNISVYAQAIIMEHGPWAPLGDRDVIARLEATVASIIRQEIESVINTAQVDYRLDVFGFGRELFRADPDLWRDELRDDWPSHFFRLPITIDVEVDIRRTGMRVDPV